jgi:hypothetical protein
VTQKQNVTKIIEIEIEIEIELYGIKKEEVEE